METDRYKEKRKGKKEVKDGKEQQNTMRFDDQNQHSMHDPVGNDFEWLRQQCQDTDGMTGHVQEERRMTRTVMSSGTCKAAFTSALLR